MARITEDEIEEIYKKAQKQVSVSCDEYHVHTASRGCLAGPAECIAICKLVETIGHQRDAVEAFLKTFEDKP